MKGWDTLRFQQPSSVSIPRAWSKIWDWFCNSLDVVLCSAKCCIRDILILPPLSHSAPRRVTYLCQSWPRVLPWRSANSSPHHLCISGNRNHSCTKDSCMTFTLKPYCPTASLKIMEKFNLQCCLPNSVVSKLRQGKNQECYLVSHLKPNFFHG